MTSDSQSTGNSARASPTVDDGRLALRDHVLALAQHARVKAGLHVDAGAMLQLLEDAEVVRYPVLVCFDEGALEPGEFACAIPRGERPADGFSLIVHPALQQQPELLPLVIAYHLPSINYGPIATEDEAELFGSTLLGLDRESYYQALCEIADALWG